MDLRDAFPGLDRARWSQGHDRTTAVADDLPAILDLADWLRGQRVRCVGLLMDNGLTWARLDLACRAAGTCLVPLPPFFSDAQLAHAVRTAGCERLISDDPIRLQRLGPFHPLPERAGLQQWRTGLSYRGPDDAVRVTFSSGSTGAPRGVCLSATALQRTVRALQEVVETTPHDRHLSLMPLSVLLENVACLDLALYGGARIVLARPRDVGLSADGTYDALRLTSALHEFRPSILVLTPGMLAALVQGVETCGRVPSSLRVVGVGGAPVARALLRRALRLGLPVFEGYGLSEAGSVVSFGGPGTHRFGSAGRPLAHAPVTLQADGEILVGGIHGVQVLDATGCHPLVSPLPTGDLGRLDDDGFLTIVGRKSNVLVQSSGRNVSPEWIESELCARPSIRQAVVMGHGRPALVALIAGDDEAAIRRDVERVNRDLPAYAQVRAWLFLARPLTPASGLLTATHKPRRAAIEQHFARELDRLIPPIPSTLEPVVEPTS